MSNLIISRPPQFLDPWFVEIEQVWDEIEASVNDNDSRISTLETAIISDVVTSMSKSGDSQLQGDVTLSAGGTIILTQVGQNIQISGGGVTAHGSLTGLLNDDHTQYILHNGTRAFTGNQSFSNYQALNFRVQNVMVVPAAGNQGRLIYDVPSLLLKVDNGTSFVNVGITDHGLLAGLGDDDHAQYLLTTGARAVTGDFTVNGKYLNEASEPMILESQEADGVSAIGFILDTANAITGLGAKLVSIRNNGVEKLAIDKDGNLIMTSVSSNTSFHVLIDIDNDSTSETFTVETNSPTPGGGTTLLTIQEDGTITTIGDVIIAASAKIKSLGDLQFQIDYDNTGSNKFSWLDGLAAEIMSLTEDGDLTTLRHMHVGGDLTIDGLLIGGSSPFTIQSRQTDGAVTAFVLDTINNFTDPSAILLEIKNQGVSKFVLDKDGNLTGINNITTDADVTANKFLSERVPVYNATLWGAKDDNGVTDNSVVLGNIIEDIKLSNNLNAIIWFPTGYGAANYYNFETPVIKDLAGCQITISGISSGQGGMQSLMTAFRFNTPSSNCWELSNGTVSLDSIIFVGDGYSAPDVTAIKLTNCGGGFVHNCTFSLNYIHTLVMTTCNHWHFDLCVFGAGPDTTGKLLDLQQCNWIDINNTYMSGYQAAPGGSIGFNIGLSCSNITIDGMYAYNLPDGIINIQDLAKVIALRNLNLFATIGRTSKGIIIDKASDVVIDNLSANNLTTYDVEFYNRPMNVTLRNYRTDKPGYTGITDTTGITIIGTSTDQPVQLPFVKGLVNRDAALIVGTGGSKAIGKLTFTGNSLITETLTINGTIHTYVGVLTANPDEIRTGSTVALSASRTALYFNRNSSQRDKVWAWSDGVDSVSFYAKDPGTSANVYTFTTTLSNATIPAATGFMNNQQVGVEPVDNITLDSDGSIYADNLSLIADISVGGNGIFSNHLYTYKNLYVGNWIHLDTPAAGGGVIAADDGVEIVLDQQDAYANSIFKIRSGSLDSKDSLGDKMFQYGWNLPYDVWSIDETGLQKNYGDIEIGTPASYAVGTMTFTGLPTLGETFVVNGITHTLVISASGANQITLSAVSAADQGDLVARDFNLWSAQTANCYAVSDGTGNVKFIWKTTGIVGNSITFTEAMANCTVDGAGLLGGTSLGVDEVINAIIYATGDIEISGSIDNFGLKRVATAIDLLTSGQQLIAVTDTSIVRTITISSVDIAKGSATKAYPITVKDESGGAGTNKITVDTEGAETIDGVPSIDITVNYGVLRLYTNGTNLFSL